MSFGALVLSHGRPGKVLTARTLRRAGYTGPIKIVVDNEDALATEYARNFGDDVVVFDKKAYADMCDEGNSLDDRRCIMHARNASFDIAKELGWSHFVMLDDDYYYFGRRDRSGARRITDMDRVFESLVRFMATTRSLTIAMSQGGDHVGGFNGVRMKRKAMNSFVCSTDRRFWFTGALNEDVNTYVTIGSRGGLFFTFTGLQLDQKDTQSQRGGMTEAYEDHGTWAKSFTSVMYAPSAVKVVRMGTRFPRLHHRVMWASAVPKIVPESFRKR